MILAIMSAFIDRRLSVQTAAASAARDGEAHFRLLAEAIPQIVWTAVPGGGIDYCSERWTQITGVPTRDALGFGWQNSLHPDDIPTAILNWENSRRTGVSFEVEYRLRDRSGGFRWNLVRATPVRDSEGNIVKWFGACTDIDDQMRTQQLLEEQIKEHTAALMEANRRLETEMHDRAQAQQELNQQNERMLQELTQRSNRATILANMSELLQSCVDLKDIMSVVAGMAPKIFPELRGAVLLFNSSREVLESAASWAGCQLPASVFEAQDCWAVRTGHLHRVTACDATAPCRHVGPGQYSYFCLPLLSQGVAVGILHFQVIASDELPKAIMLHATMFAEQVGLSVANLRLREALRDQSIRDPLTGLFNRRYLEEMLTREVRRAVRSEQSLGLLMLDLDHFKKFNDTYGHDAGDTVLRETASFLTRSVRSEDVVCRFGGEEFVVILPLASLKVTHARAERIRSRLRELAVLHQGHSLGMITVSVGVAALPDHGTVPKSLLDAADAALYRAKREGRDRVVSADPPLRLEDSELAAEAGK
jgi:diguanylate cyclase (GGDEF)-like protein/PAS domain S-box-containing protein